MPKRTDWQTPPELFAKLALTVGGFAVDAAANTDNHLVERWYGPGSPDGEDALAVEQWLSPAFCNPPYGKGIEKWCLKFIEQRKKGVEILALLPANVETNWWANYVVPFASIMFLVGRVPFILPGSKKKSQPDHASALVIYDPNSPPGRVGWIRWKENGPAPDPIADITEEDLCLTSPPSGDKPSTQLASTQEVSN